MPTATRPAPDPAVQPVLTAPDGTPERTLAWTVLEWTFDYLRQPDGENAGTPFVWTPEQVRFLLWFYALDARGRWLYPRAVLERMKGWGKDPVGAAIALVELCGPCRFGGWGADGNPVGIPHAAPWVQIAAVSKDQTRNTMRLFGPMLSDQATAEYGIDLGKEIIYATKINGVLEAVTSSPRALEGARSTMVLRNETHHWLRNNDGHAMAEVIARNVAKARGGGARVLDITNAHQPGEDSVAERAWDAWRKMTTGRSRGGGLLYDSREAPASTDLTDVNSLRAGLLAARGDSDWLDVNGLIPLIYSGETRPEITRRYYLNQKVAPEDAWTSPHEYDACATDERLDDGDEITLGFDGSRTDDATALVACRISDGLLQPIQIWQAPDNDPDWEVPRDDVDGYVENTFERYKVLAFFADVNEWESHIEDWSQLYRPQLKVKASRRSAVGWDMRNHQEQITRASEAMLDAISSATLRHTGEPRLREHVLNARRRLNRHGVTFGKEHRESARKVDALAAALLAREARQQVLSTGHTKSDGKAVVMSW